MALAEQATAARPGRRDRLAWRAAWVGARRAQWARVTEALGSEIHVIFMIDAPPAEPPGAATLAAASEDDSAIPLAAGKSAWTARVSVRSKITPGRPMELGVDTARLYFFDPDSGLAISCRQGLTR